MTAQLLAAPYSYFADSNGAPLAGGLIYTYAAGTLTPQATYTDSGAGTPNANPVVLDSAGRAVIWLSGNYKIIVKDSGGNTIQTVDNVTSTTNTGDMTKAVYDPNNVGEQLVGLTSVQTVTNKTFTSPIINTPTINSQIPPTPQGRLTLVSGTPILTSDQTAKTAIYYTPYNGDCIPIYDGTNFIHKTFTELTLTLSATNHPTGTVFDVYASLQAGIITLSAMAWSNASVVARSTSLGGKTATGNASITQKNGIWVNNAAISASDSFNNATGYAISQYQGTYLGTFYTTGNGQTGIQFAPAAASGGSNNIIGLWNAYNRVGISSFGADSTASWTYATATWRAANNNANNAIRFVDGLQQSPIKAMYALSCSNNTINGYSEIGINMNSTSATPNKFIQTQHSTTTTVINAQAFAGFTPQLGLNTVTFMEFVGANTETFFGGSLMQYMVEIAI
jgi:hypothetical protein